MKLRKLFRPKWCHPNAGQRMAAIANIHDADLLYHIATCSQDERLCLEAAHRLNDPILLTRLARGATLEEIRFEAALLVRDEATLAAMALEAWHINQGELAVIHIDNALLLRRLARSASQDAIRLAAAKKLNDPELLKKVAQSSSNVQIRWQVACHLDDPHLLAEIACFKPDDAHLADLRSQASNALHDHLDRCLPEMGKKTIWPIIRTVSDARLKIAIFLMLKPYQISQELISHLSRQDFRSTDTHIVRQMLQKIRSSGRQIQQTIQTTACRQCQGTGKLALKSMPSNSSRMAHELSTCLECNGTGRQPIQIVICKQPPHPDVTFLFSPVEQIAPQQQKG